MIFIWIFGGTQFENVFGSCQTLTISLMRHDWLRLFRLFCSQLRNRSSFNAFSSNFLSTNHLLPAIHLLSSCWLSATCWFAFRCSFLFPFATRTFMTLAYRFCSWWRTWFSLNWFSCLVLASWKDTCTWRDTCESEHGWEYECDRIRSKYLLFSNFCRFFGFSGSDFSLDLLRFRTKRSDAFMSSFVDFTSVSASVPVSISWSAMFSRDDCFFLWLKDSNSRKIPIFFLI